MTPWRCVGQWRYSSMHINLGTRWRWTVCFTARRLYPQPSNHWL